MSPTSALTCSPPPPSPHEEAPLPTSPFPGCQRGKPSHSVSLHRPCLLRDKEQQQP